MRRANQNVNVLRDGESILLSFGFDFCSEHEWGTDRLKRALGVSGDKADLTVQRYAVTGATADNLHLVEADATVMDYSARRSRKVKHARLYLIGGDARPYKQTWAEFATGYRESYPKPDKPEAFWDERAFMFLVPAEGEDAQTVRDIHSAMMAGDALLYQAGSSNPFGGSGLVIVRRSTIPAELVETMEAGFRDQAALQKASDGIGIRKRVEDWGRKKGTFGPAFFALSPRWVFENRKAETKHPVIYWLNPYDQQNNNAGWFTVEELELWMKGKGPIPKRAAA